MASDIFNQGGKEKKKRKTVTSRSCCATDPQIRYLIGSFGRQRTDYFHFHYSDYIFYPKTSLVFDKVGSFIVFILCSATLSAEEHYRTWHWMSFLDQLCYEVWTKIN